MTISYYTILTCFIFNNFYDSIGWIAIGSTDVEDNRIHLTTGEQGEKGGMWVMRPVLNSGAHWQVEFDFQINGASGKLYGDGLAFWYTKETMEVGDVFGNRDAWTGLGVFFDTYDNYDHSKGITVKRQQHPYIYGLVNDGSITYSHDEHAHDGCHIGKKV